MQKKYENLLINQRNLAKMEKPVPAEIFVIAFPFRASTANGLDLQFSEIIIDFNTV